MALYCNGKALIINGTMYCNGKVLIIICSPTKARATVEYFFPACASIHITYFFSIIVIHKTNWLLRHGYLDHRKAGEKQTRLWQLESLWGGVISHPGGSRLNQLLIKLAPWQCWGNVAHCQGNSRRLHGNQAAMGVTRQGANTRQTYKEGKINRKFENPTRSWALCSLYWNYVYRQGSSADSICE